MCYVYRPAHDENSSEGPPNKRRKSTMWSRCDTATIVRYFADWVTGKSEGLPGKKCILKFKNEHPEIVSEWMIVRNKVLNERMAYAKRKQLSLTNLKI